MRYVRSILLWAFALTALFFLALLKPTLSIWWAFLHLSTQQSKGSTPLGWTESFLAAIAAPTLALFFALAWWAILRRRPSQRIWAIAASLVLLLGSVAYFYLMPFGMWLLGILLLGTSILGLIGYARPGHPPSMAEEGPAAPARVPGDGTNPISDKLVWVLSAAAGLAGIFWLSSWGAAHGLADTASNSFYVKLYLVAFVVIALHEAGHALAGKLQHMRLVSLVIGPLFWRLHYGQWRFQFKPSGLLSFKGFTAVTPLAFDDFPRRKVIQVAAGPFVSLFTGLIGAGFLLTAPGRPWQQHWYLIGCFAGISLIGFIFSLYPCRIGEGYSDGAKLWQLYKGGLWTSYYRALYLATSSAVTPLRPRDFDLDAMQRAAGTLARGQGEFSMHLCCYSCLFDRRQFPEAGQAVERASAICEKQSLKLAAESISPLVFGHAFVRRDAAAARLWWNRMQSAKSTLPGSDRNLAFAALLWSEGRLDEARDAWQKGNAWAQQLPASGAGDAERDAAALLLAALSAT